MTIVANYDYAYWFLEMMVLVNEKGLSVEQAFDLVQAEHSLSAGHFDCLKDVDWGTQYQVLMSTHKLDGVTQSLSFL